MKRILAVIFGVFLGLGLVASQAFALSTFQVTQGGTGTSTPSGILYGDNGATSHLNTVTIGSNLTFSGGILSATGGSGSFPFTPASWGNATGTTLGFQNGFISNASSTFTSSVFDTNLSGGSLYIGQNGQLQTVASSSLFGYTPVSPAQNQWFTPNSWGNSTSTVIGFNNGVIIQGSSSTIPSISSALVTTDSTGKLGAYGGASACSSHNFVTTINGSGGTTCGTDSITVNGTAFNFGDSKTITAASSTLLADFNNWSNLQVFNGNVGIGTSSPFSKLGVNGYIDTAPSFGYRMDGNLILYASSTNSVLCAGQGACAGYLGFATSSDPTSGLGLTAFGFQAANLATSSVTNTAFGYQALKGSGAGTFSQIGRNSAFGYQALTVLTTGSANTAIGRFSGTAITSGSNNTGVGSNSLQTDNSGGSNTGVGAAALNNLTTGNFNTAIGVNTGGANGSNNTSSNGTYVGYQAGKQVTGGNNNVFIGYDAASTTVTGASNICLGYQCILPAINGSNQLNVGNIIFGTGLTGTGPTFNLGNIGIASTSPFARFSIMANSGDTNPVLFAIGSSTGTFATTTLFKIDNKGHFSYKAASSTCGTGCANIVGNDDGGTITTTSAATAVTVNFGSPWDVTPTCTETDSSTAVTGDISAISTTAFTVSFSVGLTGTIYYQCAAYQ